MTSDKSFLVTLEARFLAEDAIAAPGKGEAARLDLGGSSGSGKPVGAPLRPSVRAYGVRVVDSDDGQGD